MGVIWELDFYSRPILDEQQKKIWEVLICETPLEVQRSPDALFRYAQFCPSTQVNSVWLREAIEAAIAEAPKPPDKIRFFRRQMNNMITKACEDAGLTVKPSRRTVALHQWLQQRAVEFYPTQLGYHADPGATNLASSAVGGTPNAPQSLPDALIGEKWAFVTLEANAFDDMGEWAIDFQEAFPPSLVGLAPDAKIPGLIIFSSRSLPLAGWMSGLELAFLKFDKLGARLLLETGAVDRWILANLPTAALQTEGKGFEAAKEKVQGVHFLAIQSSPESEAFTGFWLLQELNLG